MDSKERARLRALANGLETVLQIGKDGIGENLIRQADMTLEARELIKGRVLDGCIDYTARTAADALAGATGSEVIQVIGSKFVLYRKRREEPKKARQDSEKARPRDKERQAQDRARRTRDGDKRRPRDKDRKSGVRTGKRPESGGKRPAYHGGRNPRNGGPAHANGRNPRNGGPAHANGRNPRNGGNRK